MGRCEWSSRCSAFVGFLVGLFFVKLREKTKEADDNVVEAIGTLKAQPTPN